MADKANDKPRRGRNDRADDDVTILAKTPPGSRPGDIRPSDATGLIPGGLNAFSGTEQSDEDATIGPLPPHEEAPPDDDATVVSIAARSGAPWGAPAGGAPVPGQPFGRRYHVVRLLGAGGMGAVYQVWDEELGIALALKVILPDAADSTAAREMEQRFKRELLLARRVTHKNVVRIHDIGEIQGVKYITMSYIDGHTLASILESAGKLGVPQTLRIIRQVAAGLAAAHDEGVVHRDIKPANVMINSRTDEALIMDFGIAKMADGEAHPAGDLTGLPEGDPRRDTTVELGRTMLGGVVGTLQFMAPEQAKGEAVGPPADIYALGLILYDTLLGPVRVSRSSSAHDDLRARMEEAPPSLSSVDGNIPEGLSRIVDCCLQPKADDRYQSTRDFLDALDGLDEEGKPLPIVRRLSLLQVTTLLSIVVVAAVVAWWMVGPREPPPEPDPVSVLIADFQNRTDDTGFERTLEPILKLALEDAEFITAYGRNEVRRILGVRPPDSLDDVAAREIAVSQGVGVVLSGSVYPQGGGYRLSLTALEAVTGDLIRTFEDRAANRDEVLRVAAKLATEVREALGEDVSDSAQRFAMETLSATSLDVVREYAAAMDALSNSQFDAAFEGFSNAVELDPDFGLAYAGMAIAARNLDRQHEAEEFVQEALRHLDGMTERERYRTRGLFYMLTGDHQACVEEYGDLISRYASDAAARNNLALCSTYLRNLPRALEEMRTAVEILPNRTLYRENLALYAAYASDFKTAEDVARGIEDPGLFGMLPLAFAQVGQGLLEDAAATYRAMGKIDGQGASYAASGLGDLALYEGRLGDAVAIFERGAAADVESGDAYRAAAKLAALAHTQALRGADAAAVAAAQRALTQSDSVKIRFLAALELVQAGEIRQALSLASELSSELEEGAQAYGKILEGEAALGEGRAREAVNTFNEANKLLDTWIGHYGLGRAYLAAGAYPQADSEFDRCVSRRGEAISLFLDEEPTYGRFPRVYYYQGRVREALNNASFKDLYRKFLEIRGGAGEDPVLVDAQERSEPTP